MKFLILFVLFLSQVAFGACEDLFAFGEPQSSHKILLCRKAYAVIYNESCKSPYLVSEKLDRLHIGGFEKRASFKQDPDLKSDRATLLDYKGRKKLGIDIGHLAPAGDFSTDNEAMAESFYLSNTVPQADKMNRGIWKMLEMRVRALAFKFGEVYVMTGVVYDSSRMIGSGVCVPTHLYKIIVSPKMSEGIAYMIPNTNDVAKMKATEFTTSIHEIEKIASIDFLPKVPKESSIKQEIGKRLSGSQ
jgi:endonuclease G